MKDEDGALNGRCLATCAGVLVLLLAVTSGLTVLAADWRQFRGPNGLDIAVLDAHPYTVVDTGQTECYDNRSEIAA